MKYRSSPEIIFQILESLSKEDSKKTNIRFKAFLTFRQSKFYLPVMVCNNWIIYDEEKRLYKITENGLSFLDAKNLLKQIL